MAEPRILLLFDAKAKPQSWNERMAAGEYAVLFSNVQPTLTREQQEKVPAGQAYCLVFDGLDAAVEYATRQVAEHPAMRCQIRDQRGLGSEPVREITGAEGADTNAISARFRRWGGVGLLGVGIGLGVAEWVSGFTLMWAGLVAARIAPVGVILLVTELAIVLEARRKRRRQLRSPA